jgi:hypothetical protein
MDMNNIIEVEKIKTILKNEPNLLSIFNTICNVANDVVNQDEDENIFSTDEDDEIVKIINKFENNND